MDNFSLPVGASYSPEGAISFQPKPPTQIEQELITQMQDVRDQLSLALEEIRALKSSLNNKETVEE